MGAADKRDATLIGYLLSRTDALGACPPGAELPFGLPGCWGTALLSGFAEPRPTYA